MPDPAADGVLRLGPGPADLSRLHPWLEAAAAGLPDATRHGMHVALEEAVANVVLHGGAPARIDVRLDVLDGAAALVVEDDGSAFDPTAAQPRARPASLAEAEPGGLGLTLLRHFCRDVRYDRVAGRNRLTLVFPRRR